MKLGVEIQLILDETGEVRAEDAGFVGGCSWLVVADDGVFAQADADANDLTRSVWRLADKESSAGKPSARHPPCAVGPAHYSLDGTARGSSMDLGR